MNQCLILTADNGVRVTMQGTGPEAIDILERLSLLMSLPLVEPAAGASLHLLSPDIRREPVSPGLYCAGYEIHRQRERIILRLMPDFPETEELARVRFPLMLAFMQSTMRRERCILLHGSMLLDSNDRAIILIASSGVGKSTAARRYIADGGRAIYDDQMLLCWTEESAGVRFRVHGLPTWSRVFREGFGHAVFPFYPSYPVRNIYCLSRGTACEEIRPLPLPVWHGRLVAAFLEHLVWPEAVLNTKEKLELASICWQIAEKVDRTFLPQELAACPEAGLAETLKHAPPQLRNPVFKEEV